MVRGLHKKLLYTLPKNMFSSEIVLFSRIEKVMLRSLLAQIINEYQDLVIFIV